MSKELVRVRSGWPETLKDDLEALNIKYSCVEKNCWLDRHRVGEIANFERRPPSLGELAAITQAVNRIVKQRLSGFSEC
jgi:hypothetical protein